ncbi:MAG: 23S rRNA (guanosine(2251)-2'-O)-methyltransferase RlmB [Bacteroidales bacterium]|nr:23S rRNA (guanosine(2251)-2'-O)-methyltransferase RlmB [Bacteroidales bacterium]MDD4603812.1 23S rRNA (guanosine(2251)-2'-O)-methyltransferase RlmB [Bacteroidales bacterium]
MKKETYIYGIRPAIEAIKSGKELEKIFLQNGLKGEGFRELFDLIRTLEIPFQFVPIEKLNRLSRQNHQGVISYVSEITYQRIEDLIPFVFEQGRMPLFLILDRVTDVRNVGAIARTAECAGVDGLILPARGSAQINSDAIKTSAGALYKLPVVRSQNIKETIEFMKNSGLSIIAASEKTPNDYTEADYNKPMALIMGSEGEGISEEYLKLTDKVVRIPVLGEIESLNVSVASGVILFEALRQRRMK